MLGAVLTKASSVVPLRVPWVQPEDREDREAPDGGDWPDEIMGGGDGHDDDVMGGMTGSPQRHDPELDEDDELMMMMQHDDMARPTCLHHEQLLVTTSTERCCSSKAWACPVAW